MLFNSYVFIFGFLPISLTGFHVLGGRSRDRAILWLIGASLAFYAWWRPVNVLLIAPSILINYAAARTLARWAETRPGTARALLVGGILFNLTFLGYFKYATFIAGTVNDVFGANLVLTHVILPLGISFITFQKIAFLIDVHAGRVTSFTFEDYVLFVLFFPQLVAGPIVHYREMVPQFHAARCRLEWQDLAVGASLFSFGLFKKAVLADSIAAYASPIYAAAGQGGRIALANAWIAALGFTLQIYFDFSGYSDMALGLARGFGIKLPINFNSPLRASSMIDFWLRWHVSLTRFLTAYIYNPLALALTRRRLAKGRPVLGGRRPSPAAFAALLMFPTVTTMFISGLWHGAGYTFVIWGLLHGLFLTINHGWRMVRPRAWAGTKGYRRVMPPVGFIVTFLCVVGAMVMFRAPTVGTALGLWRGMVGLNGVALPQSIYEQLGTLATWLHAAGVSASEESGSAFIYGCIWIAALLVVALALPNTLEIMERYEPAIGVKPRAADRPSLVPTLTWRPSTVWAVGVSVAAAAGILSLGRLSEFLYWQF